MKLGSLRVFERPPPVESSDVPSRGLGANFYLFKFFPEFELILGLGQHASFFNPHPAIPSLDCTNGSCCIFQSGAPSTIRFCFCSARKTSTAFSRYQNQWPRRYSTEQQSRLQAVCCIRKKFKALEINKNQRQQCCDKQTRRSW